MGPGRKGNIKELYFFTEWCILNEKYVSVKKEMKYTGRTAVSVFNWQIRLFFSMDCRQDRLFILLKIFRTT